MNIPVEAVQISYENVVSNRKSNTAYLWHSPRAEDETAQQRLLSGEFVSVNLRPKFKLPRKGAVFTIGSCFARNIERKLAQAGVDVPALALSLDPNLYAAAASTPNAAMNKYNTHSIESEVLAAFDRLDVPDDGLIECDGKWFDPLATATKFGDRDTVLSIRKQIQTTTRQIADCDAAIITLGLNEVWIDTETGIYLNQSPPAPLIRRYRGRFGIELSDVASNITSIEKTIACMRAESKRDIKVVITVSPVPMGTTMTSHDVIQANTYSKAMLRICAQQVADSHDYVDYFPSFEMVMNSPRATTWYPDQLHVTPAAVDFVTNKFVEAYIE